MSQNSYSESSSDLSDNGCQGFHGLVFKAPIGIFTSTPDGRFAGANPALARMLGYKKPRYLVDFVKDIATQIFADPSEYKEIQRLLDEYGQVENHECRLLNKDGSFFWASINLRKVRDQNGKVSNYQGFVNDITKQKKTFEELYCALNKYLFIHEHSPISTLLIDRERKILNANKAAAHFADRTSGEMNGLALGEALRCSHYFNEAFDCGKGPNCKSCRMSIAVTETLKLERNRQNIEAFLSIVNNSKLNKIHLLINTAYLKYNHDSLVLVCAQDISSIMTKKRKSTAEKLIAFHSDKQSL